MSIDFVFVPRTDRQSAGSVNPPFFFDPAIASRELAAAVQAGFSSVLADDAAGALANLDLISSVARWNGSLDIILTHWVDVTTPLIAASDIAALDRMTGGRLSLRIIGASPDVPGSRGSTLGWQKTDEYLTLLKRLWSNDLPFDHEGRFYSLHGAIVPDKGPQGFALPVRIAGYSGKAVEVAARHASIFELPPGPPGETIVTIERVRNAARSFGRSHKIRFSQWIHVHDGFSPAEIPALSRLAAAGVSEFMISGLHDATEIRRFGEGVARTFGADRPSRLRQPLPAFPSRDGRT